MCRQCRLRAHGLTERAVPIRAWSIEAVDCAIDRDTHTAFRAYRRAWSTQLAEHPIMSDTSATASRKIAFLLAATDQGTLIVNRFDKHQTASAVEYGVGHELLRNSAYEPAEINRLISLLDARRRCHGPLWPSTAAQTSGFIRLNGQGS